MPEQADALRRFKADIFQALAHPTRIAIALTRAATPFLKALYH
jgi:hypothetical protein